MSLRELAALTDVSNAYLSQIERGMHEPSVRVLRAIAEALDLPPDALLREAGLLDPEPEPTDARSTEAAIRADSRLTDAQKEALLGVPQLPVGRAGGAVDPRLLRGRRLSRMM